MKQEFTVSKEVLLRNTRLFHPAKDYPSRKKYLKAKRRALKKWFRRVEPIVGSFEVYEHQDTGLTFALQDNRYVSMIYGASHLPVPMLLVTDQ